jgi:anti-sigma factor RsiW
MNHRQAVKQMATERYLLGELSPREQGEFEDHFFVCAACGRDILLGTSLAANMGEALAEPGPTPLSRRST